MDQTKYYRNNLDINAQFEFVEADSLWKKQGDTMILVDEDRYVEFPYSPTNFREVTI